MNFCDALCFNFILWNTNSTTLVRFPMVPDNNRFHSLDGYDLWKEKKMLLPTNKKASNLVILACFGLFTNFGWSGWYEWTFTSLTCFFYHRSCVYWCFCNVNIHGLRSYSTVTRAVLNLWCSFSEKKYIFKISITIVKFEIPVLKRILLGCNWTLLCWLKAKKILFNWW